jgi:hypothetical protein
MKPEDEQYDAKMTVLKENIEHLVKEDEGEYSRTPRREQLGEEMEERKKVLKGEA